MADVAVLEAAKGSNLPEHDEIMIPDRYMPQVNVSLFQKQSHKSLQCEKWRTEQQKLVVIIWHSFWLLSSGGNSAAEVHGEDFHSINYHLLKDDRVSAGHSARGSG